jgi:uncharacterized phage protein (TIGR02218 family)
MKAASAAFIAYLQQGQTTFTTCVTITRTDGMIMGLTELDQDIVFNSVTYLSGSGFARYNLQDRQNLDTSSIQLDGMVDAVITRDDIIARRYDYAAVEFFQVNWADLGAGKLILFTGKLGVMTVKEFSFSVELRPLSYQTTGTGGELCSPTCRVDFGSPRCGFNVDTIMQNGTVSSSDGFRTMTVGGISGLNIGGGLLTWTSGLNANLSGEIQSFVGGVLTLNIESFLDINPGDTFRVQPGCDKTMFTCVTVFGNGVNFQGEPTVPGYDHMLDYPNYQPPRK